MQTLQASLSASPRLQTLSNEQAAGSGFKAVAQCSVILRPSCNGGFSISSLCHNPLASKLPQSFRSRPAASPSGVVAMASVPAAAGYAAALADLAKSKNVLEAVHSDIEKLSAFLQKKELLDFVSNPVIIDEKKKSILKTLADDADFQEYTLNFLYLLVDSKRIDIIQDVVAEWEAIYDRLTDTEVATVVSAVKIENSQLALIAKKVRSLTDARNVRLKNVIDPSLIAGFTVKYGKDGSRYIDLSVKGQLERIAAQIAFTERVGSL